MQEKVFYVWFNAPIGYMSITKQLANELLKAGKETFDWKSWWLPEESKEGKNLPPVELFQFIGKDNIPLHTVIFRLCLCILIILFKFTHHLIVQNQGAIPRFFPFFWRRLIDNIIVISQRIFPGNRSSTCIKDKPI